MKPFKQKINLAFVLLCVLPLPMFGNDVHVDVDADPNPLPNPQVFINEAFKNRDWQKRFTEMMENPRIQQALIPSITEKIPEANQYLEYLRENDILKAREFTQELMKFHRNYNNMLRRNQELAELHLEVERMELSVLLKGLEIQNLEGEELNDKSRLLEELSEQLETLFDKKMELRENEISAMEEELADLQTLLEDRKQNRETIISRYLQEITGNSETLEW